MKPSRLRPTKNSSSCVTGRQRPKGQPGGGSADVLTRSGGGGYAGAGVGRGGSETGKSGGGKESPRERESKVGRRQGYEGKKEREKNSEVGD